MRWYDMLFFVSAGVWLFSSLGMITAFFMMVINKGM